MKLSTPPNPSELAALVERLREIAELSRRVNSSGGYTLEERLDRILALTGAQP